MSSVDKLTELLELLFFCNSDSKELSLFISEHVFTKKELKISAFSLKLVTNLFSCNSDGIHGFLLLFKNLFNTDH